MREYDPTPAEVEVTYTIPEPPPMGTAGLCVAFEVPEWDPKLDIRPGVPQFGVGGGFKNGVYITRVRCEYDIIR